MNTEGLISIIKNIAEKIDMEKDFLGELDSFIGDGDHGINMARGFNEVKKKLPEFSSLEPAELLKSVGMTLVATVGGASGPLYGTAFMKAGAALKGKENFDINDFVSALELAIEGVMKRGRSTQGEKTMLDSMIPSLTALKTSLANGDDSITALREAVAAAEDGVYYTKTIAATKGRASYLGVRSIGYQDPGATSYKMIIESVYETLKQ